MTTMASARNPVSVLLKLIKRNYKKLTDARETFEVISNRMGVLDNPQERIAFLGQHLKPKELEKKQNGEVFTPPELIQQKFNKLTLANPQIWSDPSKKFLDPANGIGNYPALAFHRLMEGLKNAIPNEADRKKHILENMLYMCELNKKNIEVSRKIFDPKGVYALNLYQGSYLDLDPLEEWGVQKFDVIFGNPPYQDKSGNKGRGHRLWVQFVSKSLLLLKTTGFLVFVHPAGWRQPGNELLDLMKNKQIHYLSIHNEGDGLKTFSCNTRYDWYVLQNTPFYKDTSITAQDGKIYSINLSKMSFIPNYMFNEIQGWTSGDMKLNIIKQRSAYGHDKKHMSKKKSDLNKYPAVYSVNRQNVPSFYYSSINTNGHFKIPKVIFGSGATGFISDPSGQYALTQWCTAIVDSPEKHQRIIDVLNNPKFKSVILACSVGKAEINAEILRFFRKDFFEIFDLPNSNIIKNPVESIRPPHVSVIEAVVQPVVVPTTTHPDYKKLKVAELKQLCKDRKIKGITGKTKEELITMLNA